MTHKLQSTISGVHVLWTTTDKRFLTKGSPYLYKDGFGRDKFDMFQTIEAVPKDTIVKVVVGQSPYSPFKNVPYVELKDGKLVDEIEIEIEENWPTNPECLAQRKCLEDHEVFGGHGTSDICKDGCVRGRPALAPVVEERDGREFIKLVETTEEAEPLYMKDIELGYLELIPIKGAGLGWHGKVLSTGETKTLNHFEVMGMEKVTRKQALGEE